MTPTRSLARGTVNALHIDDLVTELRATRKSHDGDLSRALVADFAARHRLTHRDVDALVVALGQDDSSPPAPDAASTEKATTRGVDEDPIISPSGDLAWMFGEESDAPVLRPADDIVGRVLDDLLGDWSRRGGQLSRADIALLAGKRGLSPVQQSVLLDLLDEAGVEIPDSADPRPTRAAEQGYELHGKAVAQYLRTIGRYMLIDGSREVELWSLISQGTAAQGELDKTNGDALPANIRINLQAQAETGRRAHAELVCANLRLVVSIAKAKHYESCGVEFADRIQDGNLGLIRAADKFDGAKGFKFSTYATWWIKQSIERGIGDRGRAVRIPIHVHERSRRIRKVIRSLTARFDRDPSLAEIADATGMERGQIQAMLDLTRPVASLDSLLGDDGDLHLSDVLVAENDRDGRADPAEIVAHAMMRDDLTCTLTTVLPERAVRILERRFGIGTGDEETLDEIGVSLGVTRERIRQIQNKSMKLLREDRRSAALRWYVVDDWTTSQTDGHHGERRSEQHQRPVSAAGVSGLRRLARRPGHRRRAG